MLVLTPAAASAQAATYDSSSCPLIGRTLRYGSSGDDVTRLQQFLARDYLVYPEGTVSGWYGALTQAAVQRWQTKYHVVSSGTPDTTGFGVVGPRTAAAISLLCTTGAVNGVSGGTTSPVGGFIRVTPAAGTAPLSVSVTAIVNTTNSCGGATYALDFGDGTPALQIPVAPGNCGQLSQTYQHTYIYGGTYQIALSAAGHQTTAAVTVTGPAAPPAGTTNPVATVRGTISAFTTSGNAPFTVNFYVSCAAGTAYNVAFGDGTDLGSAAVANTKCGTGQLDSISHTYTRAGSYQAQLIIFGQQSNGIVAPSNANAVTISVSSVADNYSYNPPQLNKNSGLAFSLQFDLPTSCTGYDLSWGDGSSHVIQNDRGTACAQTSTTVTQTHTYPTPATGTTNQYVITLRRGPSLSRSDTVNVTVGQ